MGKGQSRDAKKVNLSGKGYKNLEKDPAVPGLLKTVLALEAIDVSKNKFTTIPPSILSDIAANQALQNTLTYLDLSKNKLEYLPDEMFCCGMCSFNGL